MTPHILDRPIWGALSTRHAHLAEGGGLARRYDPSVSMFAATADDSPESLAALDALAAGDSVLLASAGDLALPAGFAATTTIDAVQMVATRPPEKVEDARIEKLTEADATEMLALATLTRPGPFTLKALSFGSFWGVKQDGRLIAMAGERMKQPGFTELSGVCTHPDVRGRGLGRLLSLHVAGRIFENGDLPYLHAYRSNTAAIGLYESIGFAVRTPMNIAVVARAG